MEEDGSEVDNVDNNEADEEVKVKSKKKVRKVKKKKTKKSIPEDDIEASEEDNARLKAFQDGPRFMKRKSSSLSLEVEKMSQGKQLTHFQVNIQF